MTTPDAAHAVDEWSFSKPGHRVQWPYNTWFGAHIRKRTKLAFVRELWDWDMATVAARCKSESARATLERVGTSGTSTLMPFLDAVGSVDAARASCNRAGIAPADLLEALRRIYKLLPFGAQMRQLVAAEDPAAEHVVKLSKHRLAYSLAYLDVARAPAGRERVAIDTGIPSAVALDLAHRADFTRLWLMSGGAVRQLWALGYRSLRDLKAADPDDYYQRCVEYYERTSKGKPFDLTGETAESHIARLGRPEPLVEE